MKRTIEYFESSGRENTDKVLELAYQYAQEKGIQTLVMACTRGYTAGRALELCPGMNLVAVGIGRDRYPEEEIQRVEQSGSVIFSREIESEYPSDMQTAFRRFGQGTKVAVQVVVLAVQPGRGHGIGDQGLVGLSGHLGLRDPVQAPVAWL